MEEKKNEKKVIGVPGSKFAGLDAKFSEINKNFSIYDGPRGMSSRKIPQYSESVRGLSPWIEYGDNNRFPEYLVELFNKSALHSAIIKKKSLMIAGNGINRNGNNNGFLSTAAYNFIANINDHETLDQIIKQWAIDLEIFGGFAAYVTWSNNGKRIARIQYLSPLKLRLEKPKEMRYNPKETIIDRHQNYYISDDWAMPRSVLGAPILWQGFSTDDSTKDTQILYVKGFNNNLGLYAQPEYLAIIPQIESTYEIALYNLHSIKNGFNPSVVITFANGIPSDEEMDLLTNRMLKQHEGAMNARRPIFLFADSKETAPIITPITVNNANENFLKTLNSVRQDIIEGHGISCPELFGIEKKDKLGTAKNEMLNALAIYQGTDITPKQLLIENTLNMLANINGIKDKLSLNKHKLELAFDITSDDIVKLCIPGPNGGLDPDQIYNALLLLGVEDSKAKKLAKVDQDPQPIQKNNPK